MRVALVVERLTSAGGGVEQVARNLAAELAAAGDAVTVLCRESETEATPPGVRARPLPVPTLWQPWRVAAFARRAARAIAAEREPFDVVHALTRTRRQDVYRAGAGRHGDAMQQTYGAGGALLRAVLSPRHRVQLRADARIFRDPLQWIQCPSALVRDAIVHRSGVAPARTVVIPNGVDPRVFHAAPDARSAALRRRHARPGETVWLFAGSGGRRKGLDVGVEALARAKDRGAVLWVASRDAVAPAERQAANLGIADRVRFLGPRDDMPDVFRAADGLLLPTRYDPFSNACLEAAACGLPVVSSDQNGAMEVVADGGIRVAVASGAPGYAAALDRLASEGARRSVGGAARKRAAEHDWASHVAKLRDLYARVVAARGEGTAR